jgi:stress response protein YsnF
MSENRRSRSRTGAGATIPVAEEHIVLEKHEIPRGRVRVRTRTEIGQEVVRASLHADAVEVRRIPVGREVDAVPSVRTEGDITIVPILEEVLHVEKRLVLVEEVLIRTVRRTQDVERPVALRRQRAVVERISPSSIDKEDQDDV